MVEAVAATPRTLQQSRAAAAVAAVVYQSGFSRRVIWVRRNLWSWVSEGQVGRLVLPGMGATAATAAALASAAQ